MNGFEPKKMPCGLCGRSFERAGLTRHHCLPRSEGGGGEDVELLCGQCHSMVHCTYKNITLAQNFARLDNLRQAPELQAYIRWVRKQPASRRTRNAPRRKRI
ncbi:MAG: HNH endonuclease [Gemmataceae bacterium]